GRTDPVHERQNLAVLRKCPALALREAPAFRTDNEDLAVPSCNCPHLYIADPVDPLGPISLVGQIQCPLTRVAHLEYGHLQDGILVINLPFHSFRSGYGSVVALALVELPCPGEVRLGGRRGGECQYSDNRHNNAVVQTSVLL